MSVLSPSAAHRQKGLTILVHMMFRVWHQGPNIICELVIPLFHHPLAHVDLFPRIDAPDGILTCHP